MANGIATEAFEQIEVTTSIELRKWLSENCTQTDSVWLVTYKASERAHYVSREEVLDELLSFGWIDGVRRKLDEIRTMQLISPRKAQHWSKTYKDRAARLIETGKMAEPGFASIEAGKQSGLWDFMDDVDALIYPEDLIAAFNELPSSQAQFEAFPPSAQRFTLRWIKLAKTPATRAKRLKLTAGQALKGAFVPGVRMPSKSE